MNIHLRDDRIKAIVPVVVAFDENKLAVQSLFELPVFLNPAFLASLKYKIPKKEYGVVRLNSFIMLEDDRFVHLLNRLKRPVAISDNIEVREMII